MNIAEWLASSARLSPRNPALLRGEAIVADYETLALRAAAIGAYIAKHHGVQAGDRVALFAHNCTEYLECLYAIWWIGAVAVPINAKLHGREAAWICDNSGAALAFVCEETCDALMQALSASSSLAALSVEQIGDIYMQPDSRQSGAPVPRDDADLAWLFYTSGTTGRPKGVMLSHGNLIAMSLCYLIDVDNVSPEDAALYAAPLSHGAGL